MRLADRWRASVGRADVRAALAIGGLLLLAIGVQGLVLYAYVAMESMEEADRWMQHALEVTRELAPRGELDAGALETLRGFLADTPAMVRVRDSTGEVVVSLGEWPPEKRQVPISDRDDDSDLGAFRLLRSENFLVGSADLDSGRTVDLAFSLRHFASETAEVGRGLALIVLLSGVAALVIAVGATSRAFAPLRGATRLLRSIDARTLGSRLPTRGTADPIDRHAETLNQVLADIDESFSRSRSFSSDVAHELRTPLNRIRTVSEVALLGGDDAELRPALEGIQHTAEELSSVIQSLLLLAEIDDRRVFPRPSALDLDRWLARTTEVYAPLFEERGTKLALRSEGGTIEGDRTLLDRVILNLLDNALEHAKGGDRVEIRCERTDAGVTISVDDSGPGIPVSERERIFDRFSRLDRARGGAGSGLGLALARAIARLHGGDVLVQDSPLGGARFVWWLPT
jgi:signal transduction histidine kinase